MNESEQAILQEGALGRALFKSMGYAGDDLRDRPLIGIANSWTTLVPGHFHLRALAQAVENGIYRGGGTAVEFGVIAACDGIANGHDGMKYILPSREIIAASIEIQARAHRLDALVLLGSCDKIVPGMLMAAARLNIPAILVNGGSMLGGIEFDGRKADATTTDEALGMLRAGRISRDTFEALEELACPGCGSCAFFGTANTMGCLSEALGMSLPGSALVPAVYAERRRIAFAAGEQICALARQNIRPRDILTPRSLQNAVAVTMAVCGSTNAVLHLSAIAHEAGLEISIVDEFDRLSASTPQLVRVNPAGRWDMEDFHRAGGIPKVMRHLGERLHRDCLTCTGGTVAQNLSAYRHPYPENDEIIRTTENAHADTGGVAVLRGNLAPDTGITKPGAYPRELHTLRGNARVFDCEEEANAAILGGKIAAGDILVIRYEGPKGGPGMREMYKAMKYLYGLGLHKSCAVVTDGRFSGTNNGCFVGHISPEAAEGGPIAIVRDGDKVEIDVPRRSITLDLTQQEIQRRLRAWTPPEQELPKGYLRTYAALATSAASGAVLR